jgi:hypothetical protein
MDTDSGLGVKGRQGAFEGDRVWSVTSWPVRTGALPLHQERELCTSSSLGARCECTIERANQKWMQGAHGAVIAQSENRKASQSPIGLAAASHLMKCF